MALVFKTIRHALWTPKARDFIWDLASGGLPTGRGAGLPSSRCLVCQSTRDDIAHLLVCPYTLALQTWLAAVLRALKLRPTEMSILLPLGYGGEQTGAAASEAVRGAVAMAMRAARAHMLMNHCGMRNHDRATVNAAKRELREHVDIDWLHAQGRLEPQPDRLAHRRSRPRTVADFRQRWGGICVARTHQVAPVQYNRIMLPAEIGVDDDY